jgi:hypothetical protein
MSKTGESAGSTRFIFIFNTKGNKHFFKFTYSEMGAGGGLRGLSREPR